MFPFAFSKIYAENLLMCPKSYQLTIHPEKMQSMIIM